jgi:hypothetical protein
LDVECPIRVRTRSRGVAKTKPARSRTMTEAREESESTDRAREWNWHSCFHGWSRDAVKDMIKPFYAMSGRHILGGGGCTCTMTKHDYLCSWGGMLVTTVFGGIHCMHRLVVQFSLAH